MDIALGDKEANLKKAQDIIKSCNAELILFSELFTTGFDYENLSKLAEKIPGETTKRLLDACGNSLVGGSILEKRGEKLYNTFVLLGGRKILAQYSKMHPFAQEKKHFAAGKEPVVASTKLGKIALAICYDLRFPELFRHYMHRGAEIVVLAAEFPKPRMEHWKTLLRARAIENQYFVLACNRVGRDAANEYFGGSLAVNPWGEILCEGSEAEEVLYAEVDLEEVREIRERFPVLENAGSCKARNKYKHAEQ